MKPIDCGNVVVTTRHTALVEYLREIGLISADTPVLPHVKSPEEVEGKVVVGPCPLHLAAHAASVVHVPIRWDHDDRGRELTLDEIRKRAEPALEFRVLLECQGYLAEMRTRRVNAQIEAKYGPGDWADAVLRAWVAEHKLVPVSGSGGVTAVTTDAAEVMVRLAQLPPVPFEKLERRDVSLYGGVPNLRVHLVHPAGTHTHSSTWTFAGREYA